MCFFDYLIIVKIHEITCTCVYSHIIMCMHLDMLLLYGIGFAGEKGEIMNVSSASDSSPNTPAHCLRLPGQRLDLKALLKKKKFREPHGYKKGALAAFSELEQAGLGTTETSSTKFGTVN